MTLTQAFSKLLHEGTSVRDYAKKVRKAYDDLLTDVKSEKLNKVRESAQALHEIILDLEKLSDALVRKSKVLTPTTKKNVFIDLSVPANKRG